MNRRGEFLEISDEDGQVKRVVRGGGSLAKERGWPQNKVPWTATDYEPPYKRIYYVLVYIYIYLFILCLKFAVQHVYLHSFSHLNLHFSFKP